MAIKRFELGGFGIALTANRQQAGLHFSLSGSLWERIARKLLARRAASYRGEMEAEAANDETDSAERATSVPAEILNRINLVDWYHTINLGSGVVTRGMFDHGAILDRYRLPERLDGKRVLDVATFDGFWAFEFEKRGAKEVIALDLEGPMDLDWPPNRLAQATAQEEGLRFGEGFALAKEQLGSSVQRVACNIYDLKPETFGTFDVVHSGDLLLHLNSPIKALQNMARVCTDYALVSDAYFPDLDCLGSRKVLEYLGGRDGPSWWRMSLRTLEEMIRDAGFSRVELLNKFSQGYRNGAGALQHAVFKAYK